MRSRRRGFTIMEVLVVIGIIALLMAILLPTIERVRHRAYIADCGSNLRQIGQYMNMYANDNHGALPRTTYVPGAPITIDTNAAAPDPFQSGGPQPNDITAPFFLLMRVQHVPPLVFNCPYNDVHEYAAEPGNPATRSNFTDYRKHLGYSIANPYPTAAVMAVGYKWTNHLSAEFALAGDINPGVRPSDAILKVTTTSPWKLVEKANSPNHEGDGQNILYGDGHVSWNKTPFCGVRADNVYTNSSNQIDAPPQDKDDSVLLPTDD